MDEAIKTLAAWLQESKKAVFFGGAGVSTASGIPDFRSTDGLYNQQYAWPPETILPSSPGGVGAGGTFALSGDPEY